MMGAVAGPSAAAGFVTPVNRAMGTTLASTALTAQPAEHGPAPLLSQKGVTAIARPPLLANSAVYSSDSVLVGSHGNFSAIELRSPLVLPSQQPGLPSSGYLLCSQAVCPFRPVSQLTPINVDRFQHELCHHPNQDKVAYVVHGLRDGFHLGFHSSTSLKSAAGNMASALLNPQVINNYLQSEVQFGRVAGPFSQPPLPDLHVSRFGVIPKHHQPGKWRLILDLSWPAGHSVNNGIAGEDYSLQYMKVDDIIAGMMRLGRDSLMAKFDVQNAYHIVPVHTEDCRLLGMKWRDAFYVDMVLPFGVRSAPYIFTCIADLVEWIAKRNYDVTFLMHYLDDFHTLGPPGSSVCQHNLDRSVDYFSKLVIPLHPDKQEGPSTCLTILGIELDSLNLQARLPQDKFDRITALLEEWSQKRWCKRKELESLIGHLQHACKVVLQGRSFLH